MKKKDKIKLLLQYTSLGNQTIPNFKTQIDRLELSEDPEEAERLRVELTAKATSHFLNYQAEQIDIYAGILTDAEIDESIAFYTSDVGESLIKKMPQIYREIDIAAMKLNKRMLKDMVEAIDGPSDDPGEPEEFA